MSTYTSRDLDAWQKVTIPWAGGSRVCERAAEMPGAWWVTDYREDGTEYDTRWRVPTASVWMFVKKLQRGGFTVTPEVVSA